MSHRGARFTYWDTDGKRHWVPFPFTLSLEDSERVRALSFLPRVLLEEPVRARCI